MTGTIQIIKGEMFAILVEGTIQRRAEIRIWRRPDLDSAAGARNAARIAEEAAKLPARGVRTVVLDVREAPPVAGPKTLESLGAMIADWAAAHIRVAVVVSEEAIMALQFKRLLAENAPLGGRVFSGMAQAKAWLVTSAAPDRR